MAAQPPLRRYITGSPVYEWPVVQRPMDSPAKDGTVAYYQDSLSVDHRPSGDPWSEFGFNPHTAVALCQYLKSLAVTRGLEIADGPFLQVLEDDGSIPEGWVMLRAIVWVDEYDATTPMDDGAVSTVGCSFIEHNVYPEVTR